MAVLPFPPRETSPTRFARAPARLARATVTGALLLGALGAEATGTRGDVPLSDVLQIVVLERRVLSIDAEGGGQREERLERGERVVWHASRGRVGVVITDRRLLAISTGSAAWQEERFRSSERRPVEAELGDRIALALTSQRALGFDGRTGNLLESSLGPREVILRSQVDENVAVVVTDRRALAASPFTGGFFEVDLHLGERVESVSTAANLATVATSRRLLIFRSPTGSWEERRLELR